MSTKLSEINTQGYHIEKYGLVFKDMTKKAIPQGLLDQCIRMYIHHGQDEFIKATEVACNAAFRKRIMKGDFIGLVYKDDDLIGFIVGEIAMVETSGERMVRQLYYYSKFSGSMAIKALLLAHEGLVNYALRNKVALVFSNGSHLDDNNRFTRVLEHYGWKRRGYIAMKRLGESNEIS